MTRVLHKNIKEQKHKMKVLLNSIIETCIKKKTIKNNNIFYKA
jgi:hypothetical protein